MSVRAYNPADNSPVLLSDTEAADAIASGRYVLADDQAVPVRTPSGAIERYRADELKRSGLLSQQGYALDFVNGNQQRYEELYRQRTSDVLRQEYGAAGEAVATTAMSAANAASFGLANTSQQQDEDERLAAVRNNTPNQGEVEKYLNSGYSYDDALLLANASYRRPTITESMEANSPIAGGVGTALGFVGGALATAPVSIAAEGAVAARAAAALASRGLGATAASVGGRVAAGAAVGAVEAAATGAAVRVGEGIIREQLPEFSAEETMLLGGLGAVVGGGMNLLVSTPALLRSRAAGRDAPLVAPVVSNRDAIDRLNNDITASLAPESTSKAQELLVGLNQNISQVDPALNRSFFNPVKVELANVSDDALQREADDISLVIGDLQDQANSIELGVATQSRQDLTDSARQFVGAADDTSVLGAAGRLTEYVDNLENSLRLNGRNIIEGRDSPIVSQLNSFVRRAREATSEITNGFRRANEVEQLLENAARPARESRINALRQFARNQIETHKANVSGMRNLSDDEFRRIFEDASVYTPEEMAATRLPDFTDALRELETSVYDRAYRNEFLPESARSLVDEAAAIPNSIRAAYVNAPDVLVNLQSNLSKLSRGVKSSDEQDLGRLADSMLASFDQFLARADVFGEGAPTALRDTPAIRAMQSNRNQLLKLFGRDGITDLDRVGRNFDPGKLINLATRTTDADTIAGRKVLADYLRSLERVARTRVAANADMMQGRINEVTARLVGTSDQVLAEEAPFFAVARAKTDLKQLQLQGNQGGTLRGVAPSIMNSLFGGLIATGQVVPAAGIATIMAMRPDKRVAASYALRGLRNKLERVKSGLVTAIADRFDNPKASLSVSKAVARRVITAMPELFDEETRDEQFNQLVDNVVQMSGNPDAVVGAAETFGVNPASRNGSETITNMVVALEYLRQQMPDSLFEPMNPNPPAQRVSSMVKHNILRTVEVIVDPLSVYDDFANGFVSATKVQALRAVYPQTAEEMNARVLAEYADRITVGTRMPYATRMQASMLLGTPIEQALRQPNLARLQSVYAQTPAQAQAQGMSRTPTRAVTSLLTSTTTEGASLQDLQ